MGPPPPARTVRCSTPIGQLMQATTEARRTSSAKWRAETQHYEVKTFHKQNGIKDEHNNARHCEVKPHREQMSIKGAHRIAERRGVATYSKQKSFNGAR